MIKSITIALLLDLASWGAAIAALKSPFPLSMKVQKGNSAIIKLNSFFSGKSLYYSINGKIEGLGITGYWADHFELGLTNKNRNCALDQALKVMILRIYRCFRLVRDTITVCATSLF